MTNHTHTWWHDITPLNPTPPLSLAQSEKWALVCPAGILNLGWEGVGSRDHSHTHEKMLIGEAGIICVCSVFNAASLLQEIYWFWTASGTKELSIVDLQLFSPSAFSQFRARHVKLLSSKRLRLGMHRFDWLSSSTWDDLQHMQLVG